MNRPRDNRDGASSQRGYSPRQLIVFAIMIALAFAFVHVVGLRDNMTILSGTVPATLGSRELTALLGLIYLVLYAGAVLVVPTLATAAGLLTVIGALRR